MAPTARLLPVWTIVWARQKGYPPWPAVITPSPITGEWVVGVARKKKYHCTFLAWNKEWSWVEKENLKLFIQEVGETKMKKMRVKDKSLARALRQAIELALKILKEPEKVESYLIVEEEKDLEDIVEENFVEELLSEMQMMEDSSYEWGESQEESFADSIIKETEFEDDDVVDDELLFEENNISNSLDI